MIQGTYTYNNLRQELKPTNPNSSIYSIRLGTVRPSVFINYTGKCEPSTARKAKTLDTDEGTVYIFQVDGNRYYFEIPASPSKKATVKAYMLTPKTN